MFLLRAACRPEDIVSDAPGGTSFQRARADLSVIFHAAIAPHNLLKLFAPVFLAGRTATCSFNIFIPSCSYFITLLKFA